MPHTPPAEKKKPPRKWYPLENSAKIYPAIQNSNWNCLFRVSVELVDVVDPQKLEQALQNTLPRFPNFRFRMRRGAFWYYLENNPRTPTVQPDVQNPMARLKFRDNAYFLFRVRYYQRRIAVEMFHVVTDGTGAMTFLKTLTAEYLKLCGHAIPSGFGVLDCTKLARREEMEDSYAKYGNLGATKSRTEPGAWHPSGSDLPDNRLRIITGIVPVDTILKKAKEYGVTLTEFMVGVYVYGLYLVQKKQAPRKCKPIKALVPVNLRTFFPSETLRNFALYLLVGIDPAMGQYTLGEVIQEVHSYMQWQLNKKFLKAQMATNVSTEKSPFLRPVPLFLKNFAMLTAYRFWGERQYTTTLSNLGVIKLPPEMEPFVRRFDFIIGAPRTNKMSCATLSFAGKLYLNFSRTIKEADAEREFFRLLVQMGIPVKIESNG